MKHVNTFESFLNESFNKEVNETRGFSLRELRKKAYETLRELGVKIPTEKQIKDFVDNLKTLIKDENLGIVMEGESLNEAKTDEYFDYYIANKDTEVKNIKGTRKVSIPNGTVIHAVGGGYWKSVDGKIETGIESLKGNPDFDVVNNSIWPDTLKLTDDIEEWGRGTSDLIQKDPKNVQKIIDARKQAIVDIRKMLK